MLIRISPLNASHVDRFLGMSLSPVGDCPGSKLAGSEWAIQCPHLLTGMIPTSVAVSTQQRTRSPHPILSSFFQAELGQKVCASAVPTDEFLQNRDSRELAPNVSNSGNEDRHPKPRIPP